MDVKNANIIVHSKMADNYNEREPHFRIENKVKVSNVLQSIRERSPGGRLLDIGCGTGFIIDLAKTIYDHIDGVDITEDMLAKVDTSHGNIKVHKCSADDLPFEDKSFVNKQTYSIYCCQDDLSVYRHFKIIP